MGMIVLALRLEEDATVRVAPKVRHRISAVAATRKQFQATAAARARARFACEIGNYDILGEKNIYVAGCMGDKFVISQWSLAMDE